MFTVSRTDVVLSGHNCSEVSDRRHICNSLLLTLISYVYVNMFICMCVYVCIYVCMYVCTYVRMHVMYFRSKYSISSRTPFHSASSHRQQAGR